MSASENPTGPAGEGARRPEHDEVELMDGTRVAPREQRRRAFAWQLYDVGDSAFQAIIVTFVFMTYLASDYFIDPELVALGREHPDYLRAQAGSQQVISGLDAVAAVIVAVLAPALGRSSDGTGRRKRMLAVFALITIAVMFAMFFVFPDSKFLLFGAILLAIGIVFSSLAGVNYNAMLSQVATERNVGRVSGTGWGMGYLASIGLLLIALVLFIQDFGGSGGGLLNVPDTQEGGALDVRYTILLAAVWFLVFLVPILRRVPESPRRPDVPQVGFWQSYVELWRTLRQLWRSDRPLLQFLLASAVFRDGLAAVFSWGAVLAAQVYGFSGSEVIYFAVAANLVAGLGTLASGYLDDRFGPKPVIIAALGSLIAVGTALMLTDNTKLAFWVLALLLCAFVGPVQTASRSYLARATPEGHEGEIFGIYATTGRAAGWLSNVLYFAFISWLMHPKAGVWGIILVFVIGLALFVTVPARPKQIVLRSGR